MRNKAACDLQEIPSRAPQVAKRRQAALGKPGGGAGWLAADRGDPLLLAVLAVSLVLNVYALDWGLPAVGRSTWAADEYAPLTVFGIVRRSFSEWNSGWFHFKHPPGYPLMLGGAYAPYLAYLWATGAWTGPSARFPHGFADPEQALFTLSLLGRALSVLCTLGSVALTYAVARRLAGRSVALLAAWLLATAYPVVFYAHTANLDAAYLFWSLLALYAALAASETLGFGPWCWLGFAGAMLVSTKEQGAGLLLPLPVLALATLARHGGVVNGRWVKPLLALGVTGAVSLALANNAVYNPAGFARRVAFMLGHPLEPVSRPLLPIEFGWYKGTDEWEYLRQVWNGLDSAFGTPLLLVAIAGAVAALRRAPRVALWLVVPAVCLHYFGLRGMVLAPGESTFVVTVRYLLPIMPLAAIAAAAFLMDLRLPARAPVWRVAATVATALLAVLGLGRAVELDLMLRHDPRYQAEAWMRAHVPRGSHIEIYQPAVHLPRAGRDWTLRQVPIDERSIAAVQARQPEFILLSSASPKSITHVRNPNWRTNRKWMIPVTEAVRFREALVSGEIGYRPAARFRLQPRLLRPKIASLAPAITVYARQQDADVGTEPLRPPSAS
jgi:4-amino-4-deoxy-L-arabinose transferase-like glycosyltransferase